MTASRTAILIGAILQFTLLINSCCYAFNSQLARPWDTSSDSTAAVVPTSETESQFLQGQLSVRFRRKHQKKFRSSSLKASSSKVLSTSGGQSSIRDDILIIGLEDYLIRSKANAADEGYMIELHDDDNDDESDILIVGVNEVVRNNYISSDDSIGDARIHRSEDREDDTSGTDDVLAELDNITVAMASVIGNVSPEKVRFNIPPPIYEGMSSKILPSIPRKLLTKAHPVQQQSSFAYQSTSL